MPHFPFRKSQSVHGRTRYGTFRRGARRGQSTFETLSANPLINIFLGFLLTGVIGGLLTNYYAVKQRELDHKRNQDQRTLEFEREDRARRRQFADEQRQHDLEHDRERLERRWLARHAFNDQLNTTRIAKIGEVWEKIYAFESVASPAFDSVELIGISIIFGAASIADELGGDAGGDNRIIEHSPDITAQARETIERFTAAARLEREARDAADRNRFWLGEARYKRVREYLSLSASLLDDMRRKGADQHEILRKHDELREEFVLLRNELWNE